MMLTRHLVSIVILTVLTFIAPVQAAVVKITVNGTRITDFDISQQASFLKLEGRGSSNGERVRLARQQLIEDTIKIAEAKRLGLEASDKAVEDAYQRVATNVKLSPGRLTQLLNGNGIGVETLKNRLRAQLSWQAVVQNVLRAKIKISDLELEIAASDQIQTATFDYILKEIIFVVPTGSNVSVRRRTTEANNYRKSFAGCDAAVQLALSYNEAAVIDVGRRHSTQLPKAIADELAGLGVSGITKPRTTGRGVSMLAICSKTEARDLTFVKNSIRAERGTERLQGEAEAFLKKLIDDAEIVNL
ncbi:MAG: hypothetical protein GXP01_01135 [Alphaproteobacteria bacterium]|nr:hypothetical protein [Alphaproteobacteria bacterium]